MEISHKYYFVTIRRVSVDCSIVNNLVELKVKF